MNINSILSMGNTLLGYCYSNPLTGGWITQVPGESTSVEFALNSDGTWHYKREYSESMNILSKNKVDVTNYSKITATLKNKDDPNDSSILAVYPNYSNSSSSAAANIFSTANVVELNISSITGSYYIGFGVGGGTLPYNCDIVSIVLN